MRSSSVVPLVSSLVCAALVLAPVRAQKVAWPHAASHYFTGGIEAKGGPLRLQMALSFVGDAGPRRAVGEYRYDCKDLPIHVEGSYDAERGELTLDEFSPWSRDGEKTRTGRFVGKAKPGCLEVAGGWQPAKGDKELPFALQLVAVERSAEVRQPLAYEWAEGSVEFLDDSVLTRAARESQRREVRERLDGGPVASRRAVGEWLDASLAAKREPEPTQISGGHRLAVHFASPSCVSLGGRVYEFSGGAHPNHGLTCTNLLLRDGAVLPVKLADLSTGQGAAAKLHRLVCDELRRLGASQVGGQDEAPRDFDPDAVFLMSPGGIVFGFAPYEVGSYAEGSYFVHLSWQQLRGVLVPPPELGVADGDR